MLGLPKIDAFPPLLVCGKLAPVCLRLGALAVCMQLALLLFLYCNCAIYALALQFVHDFDHALVRLLQCS